MNIVLSFQPSPFGISYMFLKKPTGEAISLSENIHVEEDSTYLEFRSLYVTCNLCDGYSFLDVEEGDTLYIGGPTVKEKTYVVNVECREKAIGINPIEGDMLDIAATHPDNISFYIADQSMLDVISDAKIVCEIMTGLYAEYSYLKQIVLKDFTFITFAELLARQEPARHNRLFMQLKQMRYKRPWTKVVKLLESCEVSEGHDPITEEEQISFYLSVFNASRQNDSRSETVPDEMLERMERSKEYEQLKNKLATLGIRLSETQKFNVLQSTGYFSELNSVLYNLSDMGAGKTLMTVASMYLLDLRQQSRAHVYETEQFQGYLLRDKFVIAPISSIETSWLTTFQMLYEVEKVSDWEYKIYLGNASGRLIFAPFKTTATGTTIYNKFPGELNDPYLVIDEIHQLVVRKIASSKFFEYGVDIYERMQTFVLSGTLSNLVTGEWYNLVRFLRLPNLLLPSNKTGEEINKNETRLMTAIHKTAKELSNRGRTLFLGNAQDLTGYPETKAKTSVEMAFYSTYGVKALGYTATETDTMEEILSNRYAQIATNPKQWDGVNFELFYKIVGTNAITAQAEQIMRELGEQAENIEAEPYLIKLPSELSAEDVKLLRLIHQIADSHKRYGGKNIAMALDTAILNLNDGLSSDNLYTKINQFAEKNTRFFKYLSELSIDVLEQLPKSGLVKSPKVEETKKFAYVKDLMAKEPESNFLIVVNDYKAMIKLSNALGIEHLTKEEYKSEITWQESIDRILDSGACVVTQAMIKSSLNLVKANRLIQYQLNIQIADMVQAQNRINRIGQTRKTCAYYLAADVLQENVIRLFLDTYKNIRVAHIGIVELFTDVTTQIHVVSDYLSKAFDRMDETVLEEILPLPEGASIQTKDGVCPAIVYTKDTDQYLIVPLTDGRPHILGRLTCRLSEKMVKWNTETNRLEASA